MPVFNLVQLSWKRILSILGVAVTLDIVKEYFRGRLETGLQLSSALLVVG